MERSKSRASYSALGALPLEELRRLHPKVIDRRVEVEELINRVAREKLRLRCLHANTSDARFATLRRVEPHELILQTDDSFCLARKDSLGVFSFEIDGRPYFFSSPITRVDKIGRAVVKFPVVVYEEERRDRARIPIEGNAKRLVSLRTENGESLQGSIADRSPCGFSAFLRRPVGIDRGKLFEVATLEHDISDHGKFAEVRNEEPVRNRPGWKRIGFSLLPERRGNDLEIERWNNVGERLRAWSSIERDLDKQSEIAGTSEAAGKPRTSKALLAREPRVIAYKNASGETIRAIIDVTGKPLGATAVVIPPAWGRTKETTLGLAVAILAAFRTANHPVSVIRFDGIRKRGESENSKDCERPGYENVNYRFSQGVDDILATLDFLENSAEFRPRVAILVTFSISAVEARRAMVLARRGQIGGWISVVGAPDLQSAIRSVSGGLDYLGGVERGLRFGIRSVEGLLLDIDQAGLDAIEHKLGFLDDARRDMAEIEAPVTWICGRDDAWIDEGRVRDILSVGKAENRKVIQAPIGHRLKNSREAREIFQVVAGEVTRMSLGSRVVGKPRERSGLSARIRAERVRLRAPKIDVSALWKEYLLGKDGSYGLELIASTDLYREFMERQINALTLKDGDLVADLGSGVGMLAREIVRVGRTKVNFRIVQVDLIREGLIRGREKIRDLRSSQGVEVECVVGNLDSRSGRSSFPVRHGVFDSVIASLLVNYVEDPAALLREMCSLLKPGGRLVISSLKRDADISMIYLKGVAELRLGRGREVFGDSEARAERSVGEFLNSAARLVDLEDQGRFTFWSSRELRDMLKDAGFSEVSVVRSLGDPPQAYIGIGARL